MTRHLDLTIDMETTALTANAAVMQVAIVPWLRQGDDDPFLDDNEAEPFVGYVDLRTCAVNGFDFDPATLRWWSSQGEDAKDAVCAGLPEPITDVLIGALDYIRDFQAKYQLDSICLWCQGPDVDIAILRNLCHKYDVSLEDTVPHTSFRDCRTVILEAALLSGTSESEMEDILRDPSKAYELYPPLPDRYASCSVAHDALYDAVRSSWLTWQALKWIHTR